MYVSDKRAGLESVRSTAHGWLWSIDQQRCQANGLVAACRCPVMSGWQVSRLTFGSCRVRSGWPQGRATGAMIDRRVLSWLPGLAAVLCQGYRGWPMGLATVAWLTEGSCHASCG